jgi:microcystin-dependent protein
MIGCPGFLAGGKGEEVGTMKRLTILLIALALSVYTAPLVQAINMGEILSAETRTGSITNPAQTDSFTFNGEVDQAVVISMSEEGIGSLNPCIFLYDPDGYLETSACADPLGSHVQIDGHHLLKFGLYTIVVSDYGGNGTGNYSLSLLLIPGPTVSPQDPDGGDILSGETKLGMIDLNADTDAYTFDGEPGQAVVISMSEEGIGSLNPYIFLYDPDGNLETSASAGPLGSHALIDEHQLLKSGLYTIVGKEYGGNGTADYSLSFIKIPSPQPSPSMRIILNKNEFHPGDTLIVSVHVVNGPNPVTVEVKIWCGLPNGNQMNIFNPHFTFRVGPNADITKEIFRRPFGGSEPSGDYTVGGRLLNPMSGRELSVNAKRFSFAP